MSISALGSIATLFALGAAQMQPPSGPYQLAYTFTSAREVGFLDLASLQRSGEIVEGWSLNIFAEPFQPAYAPSAASLHWSRVRIDCSGQTARFTHGIGVNDGVVAYSLATGMSDTPVSDGWELDADYACNGAAPARPIVVDLAQAIEESTAIMASDAWNTPTP